MSIIQSLLFCSPGSYDIGGYSVDFKEEDNQKQSKMERVLRIVSLSYFSTFIHEMGHAIAGDVLGGSKGSIVILKNGGGYCTNPNLDGWRDSVVLAAGPIADMTFFVPIFLIGCSLHRDAIKKGNLSKGIVSYLLYFSGLMNMIHEITYAYSSLLKNNNGDFARIARNSKRHLAVATTVLVGEFALGLLFGYNTISKK